MICDETASEKTNILDQILFCFHPQPLRCLTDNGNGFVGMEFQELLGRTTYSPYMQQSRIQEQIL
jgi:hypothetical protein